MEQSQGPRYFGATGGVGADGGPKGIVDWVRVVTLFVSLVKLVPLVVAFIVGVILWGFTDEFDNEASSAEIGLELVLIALAAFLVLSALLMVQIIAVTRNKKTLLIAIASVLLGIDLLIWSGRLGTQAAGLLAIPILAIMVGQAAVVVGTVTAKT